jgi:AcrR family transcriptional regulator
MRVKTDGKRQEILRAAASEFGERGYHETTLNHIATRMGSSKATIYNYFRTKGELFGSMLAAQAVPAAAALIQELDGKGTLAERLKAFARAFIAQQSGKRPIALQRLLISEAGKSTETTRPLHETADAQVWPHVMSVLRAEQAEGKLAAADPERMVRQFCALLQGDLPLMILFGARPSVTADDIAASADRAVDLFLAAYAVR